MGFRDLVAGRFRRGGHANANGGKEEDPPAQSIFSQMFQSKTGVSTINRLVNKLDTRLGHRSDHGGAEVSASKNVTHAKITKDFEALLKEFQEAQLLSAKREAASSSSSGSPEQHALLTDSRRQEALILDNEIVFNEATIQETEQGIQEIQQQIGEINGIYKDLAVLVHNQDGIHLTIENSHADTAQAESQIVKASKPHSANLTLFWLLLVIIVLLLIVIILIAIRKEIHPHVPVQHIVLEQKLE